MALKKSALTALRREIGNAMDRGVDRAADSIVDLATQLAPVDEGDLESTIRKEGDEGSRRRKVVAGGIDGPHKFVDYPEHVEFGTDESPAQPFLTPAANAVDVKAEIAVEIQDLIRRVT